MLANFHGDRQARSNRALVRHAGRGSLLASAIQAGRLVAPYAQALYNNWGIQPRTSRVVSQFRDNIWLRRLAHRVSLRARQNAARARQILDRRRDNSVRDLGKPPAKKRRLASGTARFNQARTSTPFPRRRRRVTKKRRRRRRR